MGEAIELAGISFEVSALLRRAVRNARPRSIGAEVRWSAVSDAFATGSTVAIALCRYFDLDPHEKISGPVCERCEEDFAETQAEAEESLP